MNERPDDALIDPLGLSGDVEVEEMAVEEPRRAASLTLRSDELREARVVSMDAANRSLADALRITYRGLQFVMVALLVLFGLSGFQQVNQAESGIRVDLGRIKSEQLRPGFQFSLPRPFGQIIKVQTASRSLELDASFWPDMSERDRKRPLDEVTSGRGPLKPGRDGSLLTADGNIAHAQFTIVYSVTDPVAFVSNLKVAAGSSSEDGSDYERSLVRAAVERAAVRVVAEVGIDDLLKRGLAESGGSRQENSLEARIRERSQQTLDASVRSDGVGIQISQVLLRRATPPLSVRQEFNQVQIAQSNAGKARDEALGQASKTLNKAAGSAHGPLVDLINQYEQAIELGRSDQQRELLAAIMDVLDGKYNSTPDTPRVTIGGIEYEGVRLSGAAAERISEAQRYRQTIARKAEAQAETFTAKRSQYLVNKSVFAMSEWADAYRQFLTGGNVELFWVPASVAQTGFELSITSDPSLARKRETERYAKDVGENLRLRDLPEMEK